MSEPEMEALPAPGARAGATARRGEATALLGVASGDPLADRVILWTRVTPGEGFSGPVSVAWRLLEGQGDRVVASGRFAVTLTPEQALRSGRWVKWIGGAIAPVLASGSAPA